MTADCQDVIRRITEDIRLIWGEMAEHMVNKRIRDVGATPQTIDREQVRRVIDLLEKKTLSMTLGEEAARTRGRRYRNWLEESG